jgi:hypothetical protein
MVHIPSGMKLGEGVGTCSTMESKYRWRKGGGRECPECGSSAALLKSKQKPEWFCWAKKGGCGETFALDDKRITEQSVERVENPDIADSWNTVLKMAKKRAQVDATLTATGASDLLTQDLEDIRGVADDFRGNDVEDAEFRDAPDTRERDFAQFGDDPPRDERRNGNSSHYDARDHRTSQNGNGQRRSNGPDLDAIATDLLADISKAGSRDEVTKLAPRFAALPKGTPQRASCAAAYEKRIADTSQRVA